MNRYVIIVAGGIGSRMGSGIPKQFLPLDGKPLLMHTISKFYRAGISNIIVSLPTDFMGLWGKLKIKYRFKKPHSIVAGGKTRFHSTFQALNSIKEQEGWIAVHDAARPLLSESLIKKLFTDVEIHQAVVPGVPLSDSIRECTPGKYLARDRNNYRLIQTPQVFSLALLKAAFTQDYNPIFTDDASVVEAYGHAVHVSEGERGNIKITTPEDLAIAEVLFQNMLNK